MKIKDLSPNPQNPRTITDAKLKALSRALDEFGDLSGIVFNRRTRQLVGGHQRAKLLGASSEIVIERSFKKPTAVGTTAEGYVLTAAGERFGYREVDWDEVKEKAANIAANKGAGEWDVAQLTSWMEELGDFGFDLDLTMFDADERSIFGASKADVEEGLTDPDAVPENFETRCKPGDLWVLGEHRLLCGDSTNVQHVERLMGGEKADMVFTDPPYGIAFKAMRKDYDAIASDGDEASAERVTRDALALAGSVKAAFVCCDWRSMPTILSAMSQAGLEPKACIVWDKLRGVQNLDRYFKQHEFIIYAGPYGGQETQGGDVWQCARDFKPDHPTPKPVELIEKALTTAGKTGDKVIDFFTGSGSTLIACQKTGRRCFGMELDPKYCDVILTRWEQFTGKTAELSDGYDF